MCCVVVASDDNRKRAWRKQHACVEVMALDVTIEELGYDNAMLAALLGAVALHDTVIHLVSVLKHILALSISHVGKLIAMPRDKPFVCREETRMRYC